MPCRHIGLAELLHYNLRSVRVYLLNEDFQFFWGHRSPYRARRFLDNWHKRILRSRIEPIKRVAQMLRNHRALLLNWLRAKGQVSSGIAEGFNAKARLPSGASLGFRAYHRVEIALYQALGALPEPELAHRFC